MIKSEKRFDCSMRYRIVFVNKDKFYEIKELDNLFYKNQNDDGLIHNLKQNNLQLLFSTKDLVNSIEKLEFTQERDDLIRSF